MSNSNKTISEFFNELRLLKDQCEEDVNSIIKDDVMCLFYNKAVSVLGMILSSNNCCSTTFDKKTTIPIVNGIFNLPSDMWGGTVNDIFVDGKCANLLKNPKAIESINDCKPDKNTPYITIRGNEVQVVNGVNPTEACVYYRATPTCIDCKVEGWENTIVDLPMAMQTWVCSQMCVYIHEYNDDDNLNGSKQDLARLTEQLKESLAPCDTDKKPVDDDVEANLVMPNNDGYYEQWGAC